MRNQRNVLSVMIVAIDYWGAKATELSRQVSMENENELHYTHDASKRSGMSEVSGRCLCDEWIFFCVFCR